MKIEVKEIIDCEDGSAIMVMEADSEIMHFLASAGVKSILEDALSKIALDEEKNNAILESKNEEKV